MGLSSSQARLLTLTSRMHDIEYKAAKLEAQKLQMANESRKAYDDYLVALDATKIQMKTINTDGSLNYVDATYNLLKENGYKLTFKDQDKVVVSQSTADNFIRANGVREAFVALESGRVDSSFRNKTDGYYEIYSTEQFLALASNCSYSFTNNNCRLMSDIDLSTGFAQSININKCVFDGNGYSITGLNKALFNDVSNDSVIKNLSISGNITSTTDRAILANNISESNVEDVIVSGSITHKGLLDGVGSLIGYGNNVTVNRCSANNVTVTNSYNPSNEVKARCTGGLVGKIEGSDTEITNCTSSGSVTGWSCVGGLVGELVTGKVSNCSSSASATATEPSTCTTPGSDAGGLVGVATNGASISNCFATGNVEGERVSCGGLVGSDWGTDATSTKLTIDNCYSTGNVSGTVIGGLIGGGVASDIRNCRSTGSVTSTSSQGGTFIGSSSSLTKIDNCYTTQSGDKIGYIVSTSSSMNFASSDIILNPITIERPNIKKTPANEDNSLYILYDDMREKGYVIEGVNFENPASGHENDYVWFANMVNAGELFISKYSRENNEYYEVSVAVDTSLQEVSDEKDLRKAEAKYEADMKKIDMKDRRYDTELAALDNERNAIKSEMETLKTVAKDNVERTFKLFS